MSTKAYTTVLLFLLFSSTLSYARSGCCSHHGGVCGCGCCDGTGLSATCAPYYPRCNSGYSKPSSAYIAQPSKPSCPANSTLNSSTNTCTCNEGYGTSLDKTHCVRIPTNAHPVISTTDVWECDSGYQEVNNGCQLILKPTPTNNQINYKPTSSDSIQNQETNTNTKKEESNFTALHLATIATLVGGILFWKREK